MIRGLFELVLIIALIFSTKILLDCSKINIDNDNKIKNHKYLLETCEKGKDKITQKLSMLKNDISNAEKPEDIKYINKYVYQECEECQECENCEPFKKESVYNEMRYETLRAKWEELFKENEQLKINCY